MKHPLLILASLLLSSLLPAQNIAPLNQQKYVEYTYNAAGNRETRQIIYLALKTIDTTQTSGSAAAEEGTTATNPEQTTPYTETLGATTISVFPNPTQGQLNIQVSNLPEGSSGSLLLVDQTGRTILTQNQIKPSQKMDLSGLGKGIYFLQVVMGNEKKEWKIVRE
ncbi:MAG: T9SS type A sorting domain-containing protein [Bacteroidota bacterium]